MLHSRGLFILAHSLLLHRGTHCMIAFRPGALGLGLQILLLAALLAPRRFCSSNFCRYGCTMAPRTTHEDMYIHALLVLSPAGTERI